MSISLVQDDNTDNGKDGSDEVRDNNMFCEFFASEFRPDESEDDAEEESND